MAKGFARFVAFPLERPRKEPRSSVRFWAATGVCEQLFGSSREGTNLDWTYFKQFLVFSAGFLLCSHFFQVYVNSVQQMVSGEHGRGVPPDTVCWARFNPSGGT